MGDKVKMHSGEKSSRLVCGMRPACSLLIREGTTGENAQSGEKSNATNIPIASSRMNMLKTGMQAGGLVCGMRPACSLLTREGGKW